MAMSLNVVLLPSIEVRNEAIAFSQKIAAAYPARFVLDGKTFHPHVTIFKVSIPQENLPAVFRAVANAIQGAVPRCSFARLEAGRGYVLNRLTLSPELYELHERIVRAVVPFRCSGQVIFRNNLTLAEKFNNRRYGHPYVLDTYSPHVTLIRLAREEDALAVAREPSPWLLDQSFAPSAVAVGRHGDHGTCREVLGSIALADTSGIS